MLQSVVAVLRVEFVLPVKTDSGVPKEPVVISSVLFWVLNTHRNHWSKEVDGCTLRNCP